MSVRNLSMPRGIHCWAEHYDRKFEDLFARGAYIGSFDLRLAGFRIGRHGQVATVHGEPTKVGVEPLPGRGPYRPQPSATLRKRFELACQRIHLALVPPTDVLGARAL